MKIIKIPEDGKRFIDYELEGTMLSFGDDELIINLKKRERDDDVTLDVCRDYLGGLTLGTGGARFYAAQIFIPARVYEEKETKATETDEDGKEYEVTAIETDPVPFDVERVELTLYNEEV